VAWSSCGGLLATASDDKTIRLWDAETGVQLRTCEGHTNYVFCCSFNPHDNILASGSFDETVRLWDTRSGRCLRELPAHSDPVTAIDFNYDGTLLVSSSFDGLCRMWDTTTGQCLKTLIPQDNPPVSFVRFTPNGRFLLTCTLDSRLALWDYKSGRCLKSYEGHRNSKFCLLAAIDGGPDGAHARPRVVCGSEDNSICIWDLNSREMVERVAGREDRDAMGDGHHSPVLCVDVYSSRGLMASGALEDDSSVKIWSAVP